MYRTLQTPAGHGLVSSSLVPDYNSEEFFNSCFLQEIFSVIFTIINGPIL